MARRGLPGRGLGRYENTSQSDGRPGSSRRRTQADQPCGNRHKVAGGQNGKGVSGLARHGAGAALSAKAVFKPTKDFHTLFSAEQNLEIDKVVPVSASVKTKLGRGGSYED